MSPWTVLGLAFALAMDAFAVSIAAGLTLRQISARQVFRLAFHFGFFQFMMPILGWLAGQTLSVYISSIDHWLAFGLLSFVGGKMIWESFDGDHEEERGDPTRGWLLVTLSVATSIDALAVGLSLAFLNVSVWTPSVVIGVVCAMMTTLGMTLGSRVGTWCGPAAERAGGLVLIGIGLRILITHVSGG